MVDSQRPFPSLARGVARAGSRTSDTKAHCFAPKYFVTLPNS
ncbi:hypothetical protein M2271_005753 [Streptomyces sp. LBL]|nr:hypothetical protein [Streptomyces sp. LBL]